MFYRLAASLNIALNCPASPPPPVFFYVQHLAITGKQNLQAQFV